MIDKIHNFLSDDTHEVGQISNERALQLELAIFLRANGFRVGMESPFKVDSPLGSTKKPKKNLDILVEENDHRTGIELKVPLAGRVPETMYDFCADIEFIEALKTSGQVHQGLCLMMTNDRQFWDGNAGEDKIYRYFRSTESKLSGKISKPTGAKNTAIVVSGEYHLGSLWRHVKNRKLMSDARYLLLRISTH